MNTGQMMLSIGAMMLFSTIMMRTNTSFLLNNEVLDDAQFGVLATSIATSVIEQAQGHAFDDVTDGASTDNINDLTDPNDLGPENGETFDTFDDCDDFNGYVFVDSTMQSATFKSTCEVIYVDDLNLFSTGSNRTWHKKITVTVSSPFSSDTVKLSSLYSYWYFR